MTNSNHRSHGDGSIDQRGPDTWRLRWRVAGKRHSKTVTGSKRSAQTELRRILKSVDDGVHVAPDKLTVANWIDTWLALQERNLNAQSLERYRQLLHFHVAPVLGGRPLQQVTAIDLDMLYTQLEGHLSRRTVHLLHVVLGSCLSAAVRKDLLVTNPAKRAEAPSVGDEEVGQALEPDQLSALLTGFQGSGLYPIVATAAFTGARRNEILALRWSDLDVANKTLAIRRSLEETTAHGARFKEPKTSRGNRVIAIDDNLIDILMAERASLFATVRAERPF